MATTLSVGDIAIVHYNSTTDTFSFVFLRDVQAGAIVNFTDNGWLSAGGFRAGENTVTYTAPAAIAAGAIITLSGLDLDAAGDQIIAYQGDPATPTILHVADFADGNNTVAGNATNDNTTALPPGFTLGVNAVAVAFDTSLYAGPTSGSPEGLFAALNNSANWLGHDALPATLIVNAKPIIDLDADDSTHLGDDYEGTVVAGGPAVPISDTDVAIDDPDGLDIFGATAVTTITTTIDILAVNDAPQAAVAATASYTENAAPVVLSPASIATDVDNITLVSGEVRIVSGAVAGDLLTVNGLQSGTFAGIDFFYDPVLRSLKFTHPTAVADYQAFLEAVAFSSTSDDPTSSGVDPTRTLFWFISDGDAFSDVRTTVLSITALADAPVNTVPGAQSVNEDTLLPIAGVSVADVDSTALTTTLTVTSGRLSVTAGAGVTGNGTGSVTITGTATEINAALAGLAYTGNLNFNGADTLTVTTSDGALNDTDTVADHRQCGERPAGEYGAGTVERERGHDPADRRVGGGLGQRCAHDDAVGHEREAHRRDRRRRDHRRQRHRHGDD